MSQITCHNGKSMVKAIKDKSIQKSSDNLGQNFLFICLTGPPYPISPKVE